jgi:hypothetical protein
MFSRLSPLTNFLLRSDRHLETILINQGRALARLNESVRSTTLSDYEFKVFSQWGEDGIIQFLTSSIQIDHKIFIEFGVEDFKESNCRFLMMKDYWRGLVIDGSKKNTDKIKNSYFSWQYSLQAVNAFITPANIDGLLSVSGFPKDPGILSIDIDGVDYYVWEALKDWRPSIIIAEYNGMFGKDLPVSVPLDDKFQRTNAHYSNQYYGASLGAFVHIAKQRDYALVGVNSAGSNAFFVRRDLLNDVVRECSIDDCFRPTFFNEGRDKEGKLAHNNEVEKFEVISHLPLFNVATREHLTVGELKQKR